MLESTFAEANRFQPDDLKRKKKQSMIRAFWQSVVYEFVKDIVFCILEHNVVVTTFFFSSWVLNTNQQ